MQSGNQMANHNFNVHWQETKEVIYYILNFKYAPIFSFLQ